MANEHQIIDLGATPDARLADRGAIHAGVRLHFHIVLQHRRPGLRHFVPGAIPPFGKTETVSPNNGSVLQDDAVADTAVLAHHRVRVRDKIIANLGTAINGYKAVQNGVAADLYFFIDTTIRSNVRAFADFGRPRDDGGGVNPGGVSRCVVEEFERMGERKIRICRT